MKTSIYVPASPYGPPGERAVWRPYGENAVALYVEEDSEPDEDGRLGAIVWVRE